MKKTLAILLALVTVGVFAFAADAPTVQTSWSGYIDSGFKYTALNGADALVMNGYDSGTTGRFQVNGSFAYGDFGMKFRLRAAPFYQATGYAPVIVRRAYAYYNLLGGKVELDSGILGIATYYTSYNGWGTGDGPNKGFAVQVRPVDGLSLGYFVPVDDGTGADTTLAYAFKNSNIGVSYSIPKIADIILTGTTLGVENGLGIVAGVNVTAVDKLTADFEANLATVGATGAVSNFTEDLGYDLAPLSVALIANQTLTGSDLTWNATPGVAYTVSEVTSVGADVEYFSDNYLDIDGWAKFALGKNYIKGIVDYNTDTENLTTTVAFVSSF